MPENKRRCKLRNEAVQIEVQEAVQIEAQARVNQDPSDSHLPATAWPRQMLAAVYATQYRLVSLANRTVLGRCRPGRSQWAHQII